MYDPLTYVYPRTLQQAFGPYTDNVIFEENEMDIQDQFVVTACVVATVACALIMIVWG